jgi:hypothetical protein
MNAAELDLAISDLEKRGYTLQHRGTDGYTIKDRVYRSGSLRPYKYAGTLYHTQHYAVLRKEEQA